MNYNISIKRSTNPRFADIDFDNLPFGRLFSDHLFMVDYYDGKWQDARIIPFQNLDLHPASMVLHYGQAIFEGMKAFKNKDGEAVFFRPEQHAKRINESAKRMCMPELPEDLFLEALHQLIDIDQNWIPRQKGAGLYVRPFMIATDGFIGVKPSTTYKFIIFTCPVGMYYSKPVSLYVEQEYVRAVKGGVGEAKAAGNYAGSLLPTRLAGEKGYDQVMWMTAPDFKYVQEVGTMNIFFVIDGKVITPPTDGAILKGITRKSVIQILKDGGFTVEERPISIDEIVEAHQAGKLEEAFGSGTAVVISQVNKIAYGETEMVLPPPEKAKAANYAKTIIERLRSGEIADPYGWIVPVKRLEAAMA